MRARASHPSKPVSHGRNWYFRLPRGSDDLSLYSLSLSFSHPLTSFSFEPYPFLTSLTTQGYVATLLRSKAIFEVSTGANYRGIDLVTSNERDEITFWFFSNLIYLMIQYCVDEENFSSSHELNLFIFKENIFTIDNY